MKARSLAKLFFILAAVCFVAGRVSAQGFGLSVSNSPNPATTSAPLNYTILLTNQTGVALASVFVTNAFSGPATILSASSSQGSITTNSSNVIFNLLAFNTLVVATMNVTVQPTAAGVISNVITVNSGAFPNVFSNNLTLVTGGNADLGVSISAPPGVLVGDHFNYGLSVTNIGGSAVSSAVLSNNIPAGIVFLGVTPTNQSFTLTNNSISFNLGTVNPGAGKNLTLSLQATNTAVFAFTATVGATGLVDTNAANDTATSNIAVVAPILGVLVASNVSAMTYDPQTGLMEQTVQISNIGTNDIAAARLIVSNLTHQLYNAVGTNSGSPFASYNNTIAVGSNVNLLLEYFVPTRLPFNVANSNYIAVGVPVVSNTPPAGTPFNITLMTNLASGAVLIEFQSIPGHTYTVLYSDNAAFTNALAAQPSIVAPADRTQWIDSGPPKTISAPSNTPSRFYKVLQVN